MMMKTVGIVALAAWSLSGCAGAVIYGESRKVIRDAARPIVAAELPGRDADAASLCFAKGLTASEVLSLPNSDTVTSTASLTPFVRTVLARPDVAACIATVPVSTGG